MRSGITYDELMPKKKYIIRAESTVNGKVYDNFAQPFYNIEEANEEMQQLGERLQYHKLWVATIDV